MVRMTSSCPRGVVDSNKLGERLVASGHVHLHKPLPGETRSMVVASTFPNGVGAIRVLI